MPEGPPVRMLGGRDVESLGPPRAVCVSRRVVMQRCRYDDRKLWILTLVLRALKRIAQDLPHRRCYRRDERGRTDLKSNLCVASIVRRRLGQSVVFAVICCPFLRPHVTVSVPFTQAARIGPTEQKYVTPRLELDDASRCDRPG